MRFAVVGAGALGSLFACLLKEAGEEVVLLERSRHHIREIRRHGIRLVDAGETARRYDIPIALSPRLKPPVDVLLIVVKSYDTEQAIRCVRHALSPHTLIGSLQNGLGNLETIARHVDPGRVFCGTLAYSAMNLAPNVVRFTGGTGSLGLAMYGRPVTPELERLAQTFGALGFPVETIADHRVLLWRKLVMNAGANALSAALGASCAALLSDPGLREVMDATVRETLAVAAAQGLELGLPEPPSEPLFRALEGIAENKTSMLQDLDSGRRTEVDAINGAICRLAAEAGIPVPTNRLLHRIVRDLEGRNARRQPPSERRAT